ncbi:unnamed protein product, partial [Rotaria socialis]
DVFIIGVCGDNIKEKFMKSWDVVRDEVLNEKQNSSNSSTTNLLYDLVKSVKMFEVTWSLEHKDKSDKNEPFIDVAVAHHHQQDGFYLFLRQCINMTDTANDEKKTICCGYLSHKGRGRI